MKKTLLLLVMLAYLVPIVPDGNAYRP